MATDVARHRGTLLAVLSNPPTTAGTRTRNRVELARQMTGHSSVIIENLFGIATYRTNGISDAGVDQHGWVLARNRLELEIAQADGILLAYGSAEPSGPARQHHRDQVTWLAAQIEQRDLPVWMVADQPKHPSRWHRHTFASHPGVPFREALSVELRRTR